MAEILPPPFTKGHRLSAAEMNAIVEAIVSRFRSKDILIRRFGSSVLFEILRQPQYRNTFLAYITGSTAITAGARWKYSWEEIVFDGTRAIPIGGPNARSGSLTDGFALNLVEINSGSNIEPHGDGIIADKASATVDYPDGYARRPIGAVGASNSHIVDVAVVMTVVVDTASGNDKQFIFSQVNGHHGLCDSEE